MIAQGITSVFADLRLRQAFRHFCDLFRQIFPEARQSRASGKDGDSIQDYLKKIMLTVPTAMDLNISGFAER